MYLPQLIQGRGGPNKHLEEVSWIFIAGHGLKTFKFTKDQFLCSYFSRIESIFVFLTIEYLCLVEHSKGLTTH